ncbi:hypothetical protein PVMG_05330 [Plasmodium vivax Mauritania I]|uniref:Uncharacterized protein n=1 Tax=Plasmodium vivax Mauritania I TaxID=1035515 RepID=A0A0J9TKV2_PLAVI|nr:hypothetical protein PVMG_05330 [Plasmodium vivax Mauritania I]
MMYENNYFNNFMWKENYKCLNIYKNILYNNYPFLEEIWKSYNFDKDFEVSPGNTQISSLCNDKIAYRDNNIVNHKNVCKKLLRNLKELYHSSYGSDDFYQHCNNLNNWLYYEIKQFKLVDSIINDIFDKSVEIVPKISRKFECPYFSFNSGFFETDTLAALRIFNNNSNNIKDVLAKKCDSHNCPCQKFVHEFVNLYKSMNRKYCSDGKNDSPTYKRTCDIVNEFNKLYISYIYTEIGEKHKFPDLSSNTITNSIDGCPSDKNSNDSSSDKHDQSTSFLTQEVPHAIGAIAGIPPVLALIYKVIILI